MKSFSGFTLVEIRFLYSKLNVSASHEIFLGAFPVYKISIICKKNFLFQQKSLKKVIAINRLAVLGKRSDACKDLFPEVCMQYNSISVD